MPKKNQSETEYYLSKVKLRVDVVSLTIVKRYSHNFPVLNDEYIFRRLTSPLLLMLNNPLTITTTLQIMRYIGMNIGGMSNMKLISMF